MVGSVKPHQKYVSSITLGFDTALLKAFMGNTNIVFTAIARLQALPPHRCHWLDAVDQVVLHRLAKVFLLRCVALV